MFVLIIIAVAIGSGKFDGPVGAATVSTVDKLPSRAACELVGKQLAEAGRGRIDVRFVCYEAEKQP
jgi:hypothetical protein